MVIASVTGLLALGAAVLVIALGLLV